ncbi:MAG: hypothetical protein H6Q49_1945 [Deltaproteobacteria bacterium]|nr:hypothetical protein [Deltaproteobacteria bacterium]
MKATENLGHIIFVAGPPCSGTAFAVKSLNLHPACLAAIDDHVYERPFFVFSDDSYCCYR